MPGILVSRRSSTLRATPPRRLDETLAARKPVLVYQKAPQAAAAE
jgi:hypothetical protein